MKTKVRLLLSPPSSHSATTVITITTTGNLSEDKRGRV